MSVVHFGRIGGSLYTPCGRFTLRCESLSDELERVTCGRCIRSTAYKMQQLKRTRADSSAPSADGSGAEWQSRAEVAEGFLEDIGEALGMADRETNQQMVDRLKAVNDSLNSSTDLLHHVLRSEGKPVAEIESRISANSVLRSRPDKTGAK